MLKIYFALFLVSAATLAFQVVLTRFFALAQGHHFAFMAVSLALLGAGASGTYLSLRKSTIISWQRTFTQSTFLFTLSLPAAYLAVNYIPFDAYRIAWDSSQLLWLIAYYLALTIPFFFSGLLIGVMLAARPSQAGTTYAANLFGAGVGPPLALLAMAIVGGPGSIFLCTLLGWLGAGISYRPGEPIRRAFLLLYLSVGSILIYLALFPPRLFDVQLTPYKALTQARLNPGTELVFSRWNAFSRVDVIESPAIRSAPGLSLSYPDELPPQLGLMVDGDNLSPITTPSQPTFTHYLPLALAFRLRPDADTLILEPGGGLAVLTALQNGARSVTVVQSNHTALAVVSDQFSDFNGRLYSEPRVTTVVDEPRSFLRRSNLKFDLIILPLTDSFRPVTAGAYTLSEEYRYTTEAFVDILAHLKPSGLMVAERWLQQPVSESLRLWGTVIEGLRLNRAGTFNLATKPDPAAQALAIRSFRTSLIMAGNAPLSAQDSTTVRDFATNRQYDLVWLPEIQAAETNRYSVFPEASYYQAFAQLVSTNNKAEFYAEYPYAVAPPTDDHPFFFHFFRWQQTPQILESLGKTWQPFGGSGYLVLVILLILVVALSTVLIILPLVWQKRNDRLPPLRPSGASFRYLFYFGLLGVGFLFVEIPLLQHFILFLGQPAYSFAVVISTLLIAAGIGSGHLSTRVSLWPILMLIALLTLIYPFALPYLFNMTLSFPFAGRVVVSVLALLPLGVLLGIPFPKGLVLVGRTSPDLAPWVWGVNGCASVISAVLAAIIALTWGFSMVLWGAALVYGLAAVIIGGLSLNSGSMAQT